MLRAADAGLMGKPVIAGTRVTVELILEKLGNGESIERVAEHCEMTGRMPGDHCPRCPSLGGSAPNSGNSAGLLIRSLASTASRT